MRFADRTRAWIQRPPWASYALIALAGAAIAYLQLFSQFQTYDDSGHLSQSLISFIGGGDLYESVYSQYGPFYFELFGGFFKLFGLDVDTDSVRLITFAIWVTIGVGSGVLGEIISGDRRVGLITSTVAFAGLLTMAYEPMHPLGLTTLLMLAIAFALAYAGPKRATIALGCLAGLLAMVKINMGALAFSALIPAAMIALASGPRARLWRTTGAALLLLAPTVLVSTKLGEDTTRNLWALEVAALGAIILAAWRLPFADREEHPKLGAWMTAFIAAAAATVSVVALVIMAAGTSPHALIEGVLIDPTRHPGIDTSPLVLPKQVVEACVAAVTASAIALAWKRPAGSLLLVRSLLRLGVALVIGFTVLAEFPVTITPWTNEIALAALTAWIAATAPAEFPDTRERALGRLGIVLFGVMEILQAYPTAGSQLSVAKLGLVPIMALLLYDGLRLAGLWGKRARAPQRRAAEQITAITLFAMLAIFLLPGIVRPLVDTRQTYKSEVNLDLPGARLIRMPGLQADYYRRIVAETKGCSKLITLPGMYSFNIWSGRPPADGNNVADWMLLVSPERQRDMIAAVKDDPDICVLRNNNLINFHLGRSDPPTEPLPFLDYLNSTPLEEVESLKGRTGDYMLLRRTAAERRRLGGLNSNEAGTEPQ